MTAPPAGLAADTSVRDLLSSLSALQVLTMVMVDASGEEEILNLAVSAVPSLARDCRVEGVWLDGQWRAVTSPRGHIGFPAGLDDQLTLLGGAGGRLSSPGHGWLCAFPTTSLGAASGCLVVSSPEAPSEQEQALLQTLAQQTGVTVSRARLLHQERGMHERIADEQATLRRVAGLISGGAPPEKVFAAVAAEAGRLLGADSAVLSRYGPDGAASVVGAWAKDGGKPPLPAGTSMKQGGMNVHTFVGAMGGPSRGDDCGDDQSAGAIIARELRVRSVGVPIHIGGHLWGQIGVASRRPEPLPEDTERWLTGFTELVATAIASAQAQVELRDHAEEQSALRRVATLVARAAAPEEVFDSVAAEIGRLLDVDFTILSRYEPDGGAEIVGAWSKPNVVHPSAVGTHVPSSGHNIHALVHTTGRPVRIDDYADASGPAAKIAGELGIFSAVGAPISVDGGLWGIAAVSRARPEPLPADTEVRLAEFTELVATALANAQAHAELTASRARIVATADETRRRIERDLHDGAQQRLVSLALQLRVAQAEAPADTPELVERLDGVANGLAGVMQDLLEIARGIHPEILANGGLRPALKTLARRSALPVALEVTVEGRLAEQVELAAYYAVAEALTNAAKHARATVVDVRVMANADRLDVWIRDDGLGGADIGRGSGLEGLMDRVRTLGGDMSLHSPAGTGTTLEISLPLNRPF
jgi:signal transduction histidine kinase